ncbi:MAG: hydrogenase iron-sulfur subunit [Betaproteobacteria bacterium]|uniref:Hydrogenase iron-sulfur subunit n=1 Tax=Candidatus Proximibacter danicus TaxID=2954365 RepID=A0A9D7PRT7_9PROT|nr:hydrogenase iron-sulfur subunit [Candidatus Proximibacter danicus]
MNTETAHPSIRRFFQMPLLRCEEAFDRFFGGVDNPLRHLGALGLYLLWIIVGTGLYLYAVLDTGVAQVYSSIGYLSEEQWYLGGILRSLHRYASDAFILVMVLHLVREWAYGRYTGFRFYSWITGIPLIWLAFASGIGGYWIVWDQLAQFSAVATTELLDWLPIFSEPSARNFLAPDTVNDRLFTLLVFIHIGLPILMMAGLWAHVHRIAHVDHLPSGKLMRGTALALLVLSLLKPALSDAPANLATTPAETRLDWFILFIHPLTDLSSPAVIWALLFALTALLFALPFLSRRKSAAVAIVDPANCNGCARCQIDCPYGAVIMAPHPTRRSYQVAQVDADLCASCGICAGSCPSSTPFRSREQLITGIDMPQLPVNALRADLELKLAALTGKTRIVVFGCDHGASLASIAAADTAVMRLICTGMLPPSFVEYALRTGADGVLVANCREGGCEYRLGERWTRERLTRQREPQLREKVPVERLQIAFVSANDSRQLHHILIEFRARIEAEADSTKKLQPYLRRTAHHA